jgi:YegS/Rv2252/BmrU family lipid kinase
MRTLAIANPASAGGATGRRWRRIESALRQALGAIEIEHTRAPRDAERLAREAARSGCERIIVAGGDGTLSEVATGLLAAGLGGAAAIGILPLASGGDFARTLGIPREIGAAIEVLRKGERRQIDAGVAHYLDTAGAPRSSYFVNAASAGISGLVMRYVNRSHKRLGTHAAFALGSLRAIAVYRMRGAQLRVDGELFFEGPLALAAASNGRYFGGGMRAAPGARPDDGAFDVMAIPDLSKLGLCARLPRLYRGTHLEMRGVRSARGRVVEIEPAAASEPGAEIPIELDGEAIGRLPARFELLPAALRVISEPA